MSFFYILGTDYLLGSNRPKPNAMKHDKANAWEDLKMAWLKLPLKVLGETGLLVVGDQLDDAPEEARLGQVEMLHRVDRLATHSHVFYCVVRSVNK